MSYSICAYKSFAGVGIYPQISEKSILSAITQRLIFFFFFKHRIFTSLVLTMSIFICYFLGFNHTVSLVLTMSVFIRYFIDSNYIVR